MSLGRAVHVAVLEPEKLASEVAVTPDGTERRSKAGREAWQAFVEASAGKTIVSPEQYAEALAISAAVRGHKVAAEYLAEGRGEVSVVWTDSATGLACKARLDWLRARSFCDLKTARSIDRHRFAGQAWSLGYFHQCAFYRRGLAGDAGMAIGQVRAVIIAVENTTPYDVAVYEPDEDTMDAADREVDALLARLAECRRTDLWPGGHPDVETLRAPVYALDDDYDWEVSSREVTDA
jgi:hypothetical protein